MTDRPTDRHHHRSRTPAAPEPAPAGGGVRLARRPVLAALAAAGGLLAVPGAAAAMARAMGVRLGNHGDFTRVVLDLTEEVRFSLFTLADPYRVVVDLPEVDWAFRSHGVAGGGGDDVIAALRYGLFRPGNARVVLDLHRPVAVRKAFVLPPGSNSGWRLVVDLAATSRAAFLETVGPSNRIGALDWLEPEPAVLRQPPVDGGPGRGGRGRRKPVVVLDPGHGGIDPGAIGVSGIHEKKITLAAAREFRAMLEATGRYEVRLTRDRDIFLRLRDRIAIARRHGADLFLSLHADAIARPDVRGLSVYTLSEQSSDSEAAALAEAENKADIIAGVDLSHETSEVTSILIDLAQRETMNLSARLAGIMIDELERDVTLLRRTHRFAGFAVLKAPDVPSVLVEMGYLSHSEEERLLRTEAYRAKLGGALVRAVDRYFSQVQKAAR